MVAQYHYIIPMPTISCPTRIVYVFKLGWRKIRCRPDPAGLKYYTAPRTISDIESYSWKKNRFANSFFEEKAEYKKLLEEADG